MAEFLVFNKAHWMDSLTVTEIEEYSKTDPGFQVKYDARYQKGDIVEERPDGYWTGKEAKGYNKESFAVVTRPGLTNVDYLTEPHLENEEVLKVRKYSLDVDNITLDNDRKTEISDIQMTDLLKDKSNLRSRINGYN